MRKQAVMRRDVDLAEMRASAAESDLRHITEQSVQLFNAYQNTMLVLAALTTALKQIVNGGEAEPGTNDQEQALASLTDLVREDGTLKIPRAAFDAVALKKINLKFQQFDGAGEAINEANANPEGGMAFTVLDLVLTDGKLEETIKRAKDAEQGKVHVDENGRTPAGLIVPGLVVPD